MVILFDRARTGKPCSPFMSYAASAVIAEQKGDFGRAADEWAVALPLAQRSANAEWAGSRLDFCRNAVRRGWGVPGES